MTKKDCFIWYSGATDVTGQKLADELGIEGGKSKPKGKKLVIGWGVKTKDNVTFTTGTVALNHPNGIKANRNKSATLQTLGTKMVANFVDVNNVLTSIDDRRSNINLPLVGRTNYHQGGKGFWICLTKSHVKNAITEGAQYFQNYIDIKDEYRLHIFGDKVIYAQKKVKRSDVEEAYKTQHAEKIANIASKNDKELDKDTLDYTLGRLAKEYSSVDMIVRSNRKGWKFSHVKNVDKGMEKQVIDAIRTVKLDFGAVDCCSDTDGKPWIIEINSGPGLDGTTFKAYIDAFETKLKEIMAPPKPKYTVAEKKVGETMAPMRELKSKAQSKLQSGSAKARLSGMKELPDLIGDADESEATAVENLIKKRFGAM